MVPNADPVNYNSVDDYLMATTKLEGDHYKIDNAQLYNDIKPLLVDGAGWAFVKRYNRRKDGRGAVMALRKQAKGKPKG